MNDNLQNLNILIKKEADEILYEKGLMSVLHSFGTPHIHGSYLLDLMTWRDLDIYLEIDAITNANFFMLGAKVCALLSPVKMNFRNEQIAQTPALPVGLYWGIYLGNERNGAWKIDIWAVATSEYQKLIYYHSEIKKKLTPATITTILDIKSQCWKDPHYRRLYSSATIYEAVLEHNITNMEGFRNFLENNKIIE